MRSRSKGFYSLLLLLFVSAIVGSTLFTGCKGKKAFEPSGDTIVDGKQLVQKYCVKCHEEPDPGLLPKAVWKFHTLPDMAHYLGISTYFSTNYYKKEGDTSGASLLEWQAIQAYYQKAAPKVLLRPKGQTPLIDDWAGFTLKTPATNTIINRTTMVAVNAATRKLYTCDALKLTLKEWDSNLKPRDVAQLPSPAMSGTFVSDDKGAQQGVFSCIGQMAPADFPNGNVVMVSLDGKTQPVKPASLADDLNRPVQTLSGDFNKDGLNDFVILAQGHFSGGVYLLQQNADHTYSQTSISKRPGAIQAVIGDFNKDGWPDVMVLYGAGDEGLWMYLNDQKGGFTSRNLLHFPPTYGSSSFQLADINHDGKPDLIYTSGYNFKDSRVLKPYHGLYIFTNEGDWKFKQAYHYPIDGCTKAIAADFDGDGDLDIATIAFFADLKGNPAESFIYFEQDKPMSFKPHAIPVSKYGRWMSMDVADINNDGKPDIILGNYAEGMAIQEIKPFWGQNLPFIVLENHTKK